MSPSSNDDTHLIGTIKATTDSVTEMMGVTLKQTDAIVKQLKGELNNADMEFEKLSNVVMEKLGHLEQLIIDPDKVGRDEAIGGKLPNGEWAACESSDERRVPEPMRVGEVADLIEIDGPPLEDLQPQYSLLKRAQENLEELKQTTGRKFDAVLGSLAAAKNEAKDRIRHQKETREKVETNLRNVEESLKDLLKARI